MLKKKLAVLLISLFTATSALAQDPEFSQFYAAPLYLNPAFAGTAGGPRFILNYRNQWPGVQNAYEHFAFSYDQHIPMLGGGIGLLVTNDNQADGVFRNTHASGVYSYQLRVNREVVIKSGISATYANHTVDTDRLIWGYDQQGNVEPSLENYTGSLSANFIDFATGAVIFSERLFAGVAVDHLVEPNQSVVGGNSPLLRKYTAHAGAFFPVGKRQANASVSPNILYQQQGTANQLNLGMYYNRGPVVVGGWYRTSFVNGDAFIALVGVKYDIYKVGYSYDVVTSALRSSASGAHEVSLAIELPAPQQRARGRSFKRINCPAF